MFKKSDENEWSRFSKALSNKEREREDEVADQDDGVLEPPVLGQAATSPSTQRATQDINVSVTRPARPTTPEVRHDQETFIGEKTFFDGTFRSEESIRIRGTVQGEVESKQAIYIEEQAKVTAKVTGSSVTVAGQVNGQIQCSGRVEIKPSGRVTGEITAGTLIMQEGAFFEGHLKMASRGEAAPVEATTIR